MFIAHGVQEHHLTIVISMVAAARSRINDVLRAVRAGRWFVEAELPRVVRKQ